MKKHGRKFRARGALGVFAIVTGVVAGIAGSVAVPSAAGAMGFDNVLERSGTEDLGDDSTTFDIGFGYDPSVRFRVFVNGNNVANGTTVSPGDQVEVQYDIGDNNDNPGAFTDLDFLPNSGVDGERLYGESAGDLTQSGKFRSRIESTRSGLASTGGDVFRLTNVDLSRWGNNNTCGSNSRTDAGLNDADNVHFGKRDARWCGW